MSRLVMCGWETGSVNEIGVYDGSGGTSIESIVAGRSGAYAYRAQTTAGAGSITTCLRRIALPSAPNEIWLRVGIGNVNTNSGGGATYAQYIVSLEDGTTVQIGFGFKETTPGIITVWRGTTEIASGGGLPGAGFVCIEAHIVIHGSAGVVTIWVDGQQVVNFSGNTLASSTAQITTVGVGIRRVTAGSGGTITDRVDYDDLAINDTTGSVNNGRIGQGGIVALRPTADTGEKDWTPSIGVDNFARVNSAPPLGDASYVSTANSGDLDLYELPNLSGGGEIDAVAVIAISRVVSGAGRALAPALRSGAVTAIGSAFMLTNTYATQQQIYNGDPNTGAAWTLTAVNSVQCGMTIVS